MKMNGTLMKKNETIELVFALCVISIVTILSYGVLIPQLGLYRDDWYMLLAGQTGGASEIINLFTIDRPLIGYIYALDYSVLGNSVLGWHLYALFLRLVGSFAFFFLLRTIWKEKKIETTIAALLFAVYPGFLQQPNAATFKNLLLGYDFALFSILVSILALKAKQNWKKVLLILLAMALESLYLGIFEAMIGLEGARLLLFWYFLWRESEEKSPLKIISPLLKQAAPYLLLGGAFVFWRVFIFKSLRPSTDIDRLFVTYKSFPLQSMAKISIETIKDIWEAIVLAWFIPFYKFTNTSSYEDFINAFALAILAVGVVFFYIKYCQKHGILPEKKSKKNSVEISWMWMGVLIVGMAVLPIVVSGRNISFEVQWDRYTYHTTIGAILALTGFIFYTWGSSSRWIVSLALIAMSVMTHYFSADYYRDYWSYNRELWWQMSWRAPSLEKRTMIFVSMPFGFAEDYEIYSPANMIYYPGEGVILSAEVLNTQTVRFVQTGEHREDNNRNVYVPKKYNKSLIVSFPEEKSCLHVLDGRQLELPGFSRDGSFTNAAPYSQISQIDVTHIPAKVPESIFGTEPEHSWCYFYQKMNLAKQMEDWDKVAQLADEATASNFHAQDRSEWLASFEAYIAVGEIEKAKEIASYIKKDPNTHFFLCKELERGAIYPAPYDYEKVIELLCEDVDGK